MPTQSFVEEMALDSAADFVSHLRLSNPLWGSDWRAAWMFRGHADANWALVPRARRADGRVLLRPILRRVCEREYAWTLDAFDRAAGDAALLMRDEETRMKVMRVQQDAESAAVREFAALADELGLRITDIHIGHKEGYEGPMPPEAIAQHHGVPTRLLDWSRKPLVAAFFAIAEPNASDRIAVWALNTADLGQGDADPFGGAVRCFQCPRSSHAFQHAQDGLFTWTKHSMQYNFLLSIGRWPSVVDILKARPGPPSSSVLRKLTLPRSEVPALRRLLWREHVSKAHLMPTFDHVREALFSKWECEDGGS